jgi:hypothetical protein
MSRPRPQRALITGATSGIGEAFARALPPTCHLLLTGRNADKLAQLQGELARDGRQVETLVADLAGDKGRDALAETGRRFDPDLLVANAGIGAFGRVVDNDADAERRMIELNVVAPAVLTRALLPGMLERARRERRRAGVIVLSSTAAFQPLPYLSTYAATKAFDLFYARGLAAEMHGEPLDVLAVCPGPTATAFFERAGSARPVASAAMSSPQDVARQALAALGRQDVVTVGAGNRAYRALAKLAPTSLLRGATRSALRRNVRQG